MQTRRSLGSRLLHPKSAFQRLLFADSAATRLQIGFFFTDGAALVFAAGAADDAEADAALELVAKQMETVEISFPSAA